MGPRLGMGLYALLIRHEKTFFRPLERESGNALAWACALSELITDHDTLDSRWNRIEDSAHQTSDGIHRSLSQKSDLNRKTVRSERSPRDLREKEAQRTLERSEISAGRFPQQ
ncbi:MAG: hypothetical protein AUJ07_08920 [Crenarchaeota archaeon 13_1_40CM_3_53_5]|nr:MAG: hypothetical protein AUJ07_08920 [Crenarchaeota archaeon 13_1_40CM_3_53_5]